MAATPNDVLGFWRHAGPEKWFIKNSRFDDAIQLKFEPVHHRAARGEYDAWALTPEGSLALLILLDQFPRNIFRGSAHSYATDSKARSIARAATDRGWHKVVDPELRQFFILPFEHSEDLADQDRGLELAQDLGDPEIVKWVKLHRDIIVRFGRFPHRNPVMGRQNTVEEILFLNEGGFAG